MISFGAVLEAVDGSTYELPQVVSFSLDKERYTPYSLLTGTFVGMCTPWQIKAVRFFYDGEEIHFGTADRIISRHENGSDLIVLRSYGMTKQLSQTQAEPGLISNPDLNTIISKSNIYGVYCQGNTNTAEYVYIKEKTSLWDAARIYAMKAYNTAPFIRRLNTVVCSLESPEVFDYEREMFSSYEFSQYLDGLISDAYTNGLDNEWNYHIENTFAKERLISKAKYYQRDLEWVYALEEQLKYNMYFADKARTRFCFTYAGYRGEDICDKANLPNVPTLENREIDRVRLYGSDKGIFTHIECYTDSYCK